jgi:hypothetical protein
MRLPSARTVLPPLAAVLVVGAGAAVLWSGLSRTAAFGGDADLAGRLPAVTQPAVVTVPGLLELSGGRVTVVATAAPDRQVFVGVGRSEDVEAYLGGAARADVTALEADGRLRVAARAGEPALPDPAGADVWAASARGPGGATLTWPRVPGSWRVLVAVDGRSPPAAVTMTWAGRTASSPAPALIAVGAVVLVAGVAALLAIRSGRVFARRSGADDDDIEDDEDVEDVGGPQADDAADDVEVDVEPAKAKEATAPVTGGVPVGVTTGPLVRDRAALRARPADTGPTTGGIERTDDEDDEPTGPQVAVQPFRRGRPGEDE